MNEIESFVDVVRSSRRKLCSARRRVSFSFLVESSRLDFLRLVGRRSAANVSPSNRKRNLRTSTSDRRGNVDEEERDNAFPTAGKTNSPILRSSIVNVGTGTNDRSTLVVSVDHRFHSQLERISTEGKEISSSIVRQRHSPPRDREIFLFVDECLEWPTKSIRVDRQRRGRKRRSCR